MAGEEDIHGELLNYKTEPHHNIYASIQSECMYPIHIRTVVLQSENISWVLKNVECREQLLDHNSASEWSSDCSGEN